MDQIATRYQVRRVDSDLGFSYWRVVDTRDGRWSEVYTREALASLRAARMNRAQWAERAEAGTW
jgi:hypothetical protein